jgi:hypothetical protein
MNKEKIYKISLGKVTDTDINFIGLFAKKSREVLEQLLKINQGVLKVNYLESNEYHLTKVEITPNNNKIISCS